MCVKPGPTPCRRSSRQIARPPSWRAKGRGDRKDLIVDVVLGIGFLCSIIVRRRQDGRRHVCGVLSVLALDIAAPPSEYCAAL
jgi:hypothetical protein